MTDTAPDTGTPDTPAATTEADPAPSEDTVDWKAEAEKYRALHRKQEERAKANASAAKELEQLRQQTMSEQERAVAAAREEARAAAFAEVGTRVAAAEFRAVALGTMTEEQVEALLETTNLTVFIDDSGEVDRNKLADFVGKLAPSSGGKPRGSADGGARNGSAITTQDPRALDIAQIEGDIKGSRRI